MLLKVNQELKPKPGVKKIHVQKQKSSTTRNVKNMYFCSVFCCFKTFLFFFVFFVILVTISVKIQRVF